MQSLLGGSQGCKQDLFFRDRYETETFESLFETRPRPSILASRRDRDRDLSRPRSRRFLRWCVTGPHAQDSSNYQNIAQSYDMTR